MGGKVRERNFCPAENSLEINLCYFYTITSAYENGKNCRAQEIN
jgi:hypothetical protein